MGLLNMIKVSSLLYCYILITVIISLSLTKQEQQLFTRIR